MNILKQLVLLSIRNFNRRWAIGWIGAVVFVFGIVWQHAGLLGCGAVVLCLSIRQAGNEKHPRKRATPPAANNGPRDAPSPQASRARTTTTETDDDADNLSSLDELQSGGADSLVNEMLSLGRYALLLRPETSVHLSSGQLTRAVRLLDEAMALVPNGNVWIGQLAEQSGSGQYFDELDAKAIQNGLAEVPALYFDRRTVTNSEFRTFVDDGGYELLEFWSEEALPALLDFVDQTGLPGPRFWRDGTYEGGEDRLPVVGVSWYEACAYARWAGKRLPNDAEWTKAGAWPVESAPGRIAQRRYPWGESFDVRRANLWGAGHKQPVAVDEYPGGISVGGVHQLIGNVWEWTASALRDSAHPSLHVSSTMKSIRGGAFDTYFENQATCHYQSGELPLARRANIGFRLALSMSVLEPDATDTTLELADLDCPPESNAPETASAC